jgi:hypothetical protein
MHRVMIHRHLRALAFVVGLIAISMTTVLPAVAAPSGGRPGPVLMSAMAAPGTVLVSGGGFTSGGRVFVAVYDAWGTAPVATLWTNASPAIFGVDGSQDPAAGFVPGGLVLVNISFAGPCGTAPMARAYDVSTRTWSAVLDADTRGLGTPVYGPDGSQDPAQGYRPGC